MMLLVLIVVCGLAYIISKRLYQNIFNPVVIFVGVNILSIVLSLLQNFNFEYTVDTVVVTFVMFISFLIGIILGVKKGYKRKQLTPNNYYEKNIFRVIVTLGLIYDIALVGYLHQLFSSYSFIDFFLKLNEVNAYVQSDEYQASWFSYVIPLGMPLFIICLFYLRNYNKNWIIVTQSFLSVLYCISPRRDTLFNLIVVVLFYFLANFQERYRKNAISKKIVKYIVLVGVGGVLIMSYTQQLLKKDNENPVYVLSEQIPAYLNSPYLYISLNYPYLQKQELDYSEFPDIPFLASGRLAYIAINRVFGTDFDLHSGFALDFETFDKTYSTNTTPLLYYAYLDLGGAFFLLFILIGFISQRAYYAMNSNKITDRIFGAMWYTVLTLSFRSYLIVFLTYILSFVYTYIFSKLLKTRIIK